MAGARLQATTLAHRLLRVLGRRRHLADPGAGWGPGSGMAAVGWSGVGGADGDGADGGGAGGPDGAVVVVAGHVAPSGATGATGAAGRDAGVPDAALARVLARARAAGAPPAAVAALADAWADLAPADRRTVDRPLGDGRPGPLRVGGAPARQTDGTTCGSAVLSMLAATGDPVLALWLATGRLVPGHLPPELRAMPAAHVTAPDAAVRLSALQRGLKRASTRRALGPLPWPVALGTPPWGAARTARFPGVRWTHVLVDDTDPALVDAVLHRADAALAVGVPVPLFTGGDLGGGAAAALPRHVVLLVPSRDGSEGYSVYEPAGGRVHRVTRAELARPGGRLPALGGWSHVCWALLPDQVASAVRSA